MARESIIVLALLGGGFVVTLIGSVLWSLKKKGGIVIAVIGAIILFSSLLFIPEGDNAPEPTIPAEAVLISEVKAEYDKNTLAADDLYKGNRYRITGTIESIGDGGLNGVFGELSVTVIVEEGENNYYLWCTFDEETQRDALSKLTMGDTITFEGTCESWGNWHDCELVEE